MISMGIQSYVIDLDPHLLPKCLALGAKFGPGPLPLKDDKSEIFWFEYCSSLLYTECMLSSPT